MERRVLCAVAVVSLGPSCSQTNPSGKDTQVACGNGGACAQGDHRMDDGDGGDGVAGDCAGDTGAGGTPPGDSPGCVSDDGSCAAGCAWFEDDDCPMCGTTGMLTPMLRCSPEHPCTNILESYSNPHVTDPPLSGIDFPSFVPACTTTDRGSGLGRGMYDDGPPVTWNDSDGVTRYRCEYRPVGTSATSKRPLLLFVHGSGGYAYSVYDTTSLRDKAQDFDITGDASRPGFILVAVQGRNLHWPTTQPQDGAKHDTFFRDLASPSANRDIAYYDHIIDSLVTEGAVDADRIFISGWSNGARFAALYGIARHDTPTPGGNRVAAVVNYSGGDPFSNGHHGQVPSCQQAVYPTSAVPFLLISRTCDAIACNEAQDRGFRDAGAETSPGNVAESWVQTLRSQIANPNVTWIPITRNAVSVAEGTCASAALCSPIGAFLNHLHWPDGVEDQTGVDLEPVMLQFMRDHPLD